MKKLDHWSILIALLLSSCMALLLRFVAQEVPESSVAFSLVEQIVEWSRFIGELFMRALKMIIVPLIVTSIIAGISSLRGLEGFARLGLKTIGFYTLSTTLAIVVGLIFVNGVAPGLKGGEPNAIIQEAFSAQSVSGGEQVSSKISLAQENADRNGSDFLQELLRKMIPTNIIESATNNGNMLGLIVFSLLAGVAITKLSGRNATSLSTTFESLNEMMILITNWVMKVAPYGIYALILPVVFESGGELFSSLGKYFGTVLGALLFHLFIILPLLLFLFGRINPLNHFYAMKTALLTAFSTASSSATLPVTLRGIQEEAGVSKKVSSFTIPLGATVNMDGTALYECVAVIFVTQALGIEMGLLAQIGVVVAALLTSVGVAGIPSASLVAILTILNNTGVPNAEIAAAALLAVDRPLDMCRTAVNVFGDSCAAAVVAKSEGEELYQKETVEG